MKIKVVNYKFWHFTAVLLNFHNFWSYHFCRLSVTVFGYKKYTMKESTTPVVRLLIKHKI